MNNNTKYYGVQQANHGHVYRWIFDEKTLSREVYNGGEVRDNEWLDCSFPMGGSNSGSTEIILLEGEDDIEGFLTGTAMCEYEDPSLCDIAEFYLTVDCDHESCTGFWLDRLGISIKDCGSDDDAEEHRARAWKMIHDLGNIKGNEINFSSGNWTKLMELDFADPFYGASSDMRFSELEALYKEYKQYVGMTAV